ncbi:MAG: hypothetical protein ACR2LI_00115 [Propionibacteriaceae bacterium]
MHVLGTIERTTVQPTRSGRAAARQARDRTPEGRYDWLPAGPFRAHVRHVSVITGTPWPVLAVLARVSLPAVRSLVVGRHGRGDSSVRRLCPDVAERLFELTSMRVRQAATRPVPAQRAAVMLRNLTVDVSVAEVAHRLGLRRDQLGALLIDPSPATCPELVAASVEAAYRLAWARPRWPHVTPAELISLSQAA